MKVAQGALPPLIPAATYRLQFNHQFTLRQATAILDHLHAMGISDCYASPLFTARPGSLHGYDVIDPTKLNPELGPKEDFDAFAAQLRAREMGLVMDVVPNHMCIAGAGNKWWDDVLENGPGSPFASYFDIDWHPPKQNLQNKVLLPMLGDQYGRVLENQEIQLVCQRGSFFVKYYETKLPIAPRASILILKPVLEAIGAELEESNFHRLELESIITALEHLPPRTETDPEKVKERRREKEIVKRRLSALLNSSGAVRRALNATIRAFNGNRDDPRSFDRLEALLADQAYRLCHWRVAADEINYRRFFDVNELAAIRVEEPKVFAAVHEMVFRLMREGVVTGLRVDHIDGLADPQQYLRNLQRGCRKAIKQAHAPPPNARAVSPCYVVVEKILGRGERLHETWPAAGTTGYDFLNLLNGVFVDGLNESAFRKLYARLTGVQETFADVAYESKKLILRVAMSGELHVLARRLDRISERRRYSRDFTLNSLQHALSEVIACFPVYRGYLRHRKHQVGAEDRRHITTAVHHARRRNPNVSPSIFAFIQSLLLLEGADQTNNEQRAERMEFVLRFQQLTGPVAAKGIEDTAFYRFFPLASLCEVGGDADRFGISVDEFHARNRERIERWPHTLLATSTHDTKRSEDARARINALSEIPARWYRAVRRWQKLNQEKKRLMEDAFAPDANEEYLLYQTLVGLWPLSAPDEAERESLVRRIQEYMVKALREGRIHSSWLSSNEEYEQAVRDFIARILAPEDGFLPEFSEFLSPVARAGMFNSLSQTLLKIAAPGVPDFYQGSESWDFSLVDPDNRRPVDYEARRRLFNSLPADRDAALIERMAGNPADGRIKMFVTSRALNFRRDRRELFALGAYLPLQTGGDRARHVIAFARQHDGKTVIAAAARFFTPLLGSSPSAAGGAVWRDTHLLLPDELASCYRNVFTGGSVCAEAGGTELPLAEAFAQLPFTLLEGA